jgi:hypothetical protein
LVDRIVVHKMKEANRSGTNAADHLRKRKATAEANIASQEKRITAGLLAAAGKFHLCEDVRNFVQQKNANVRQKEYERRLKTKNEYDTLCAQVQAVKDLNVPPDKWNQAQLRTMVKWYKRDGDDKMPSKKQDQLARYHATCSREDLPAPQLLDGPPPLNDNGDINDNAVSSTTENDGVMDPSHESDEEEVAAILLAAAFSHHQEVTAAVAAAATSV